MTTFLKTTRYEAAAAVKSAVISAVPATLVDIQIQNVTAGVKYIQLFDSATVPADTAVPNMCFTIPASGSLNITLNGIPEHFATGIAIASSSTQATKTLSATSDIFFTARTVA